MSENNTPGTGTNRPGTPPPARRENKTQSRYGLRFDQMDPEELEYYRPFWDVPRTLGSTPYLMRCLRYWLSVPAAVFLI